MMGEKLKKLAAYYKPYKGLFFSDIGYLFLIFHLMEKH